MYSAFKKFRDFVLGEDLTHPEGRSASGSGDASCSAPSPLRQAFGRSASRPAEPGQQQKQRRTKQQAAAAAAEPTTAALPRGPGILQDVATSASGGVQGLSWFGARLRQDADGDVADQFLSEKTFRPTAGGKAIAKQKCTVEVQRKRLRPAATNISVRGGDMVIAVPDERIR